MDATSRTQTEVKLAHRGFILAWFCLLFMVHKMNLPLRHVSAQVFVALFVLGTSAILVGFAMRSKLFKIATEAQCHDLHKASESWRSANLVGFCCAINPTIYGVVLKMLGTGWLGPGILFGFGLSFLLLWSPRPLAVSGVQPA